MPVTRVRPAEDAVRVTAQNRALLVVNPASAGGRALRAAPAVVGVLREAGWQVRAVRSRSLDDSAVPSGTSSMVRALLRLAEAGRAAVVPPLPEATAWAQAALLAAAPVVREQPVACSGLVVCAVRLAALLQLPGAPVCTPDGCTWPSASGPA